MTDEFLPNEENDLFYFESDHLALKGNIEYSELIKSLFVLEAQRKKAIDVSVLANSNKTYFFNETLSF